MKTKITFEFDCEENDEIVDIESVLIMHVLESVSAVCQYSPDCVLIINSIEAIENENKTI